VKRFAFLLLAVFEAPVCLLATTYTVTVAPAGSFTFDPSSQTINVGDTVTWTWGLGLHSTTSGALCLADDKWNSDLQVNPTTFSVTFTSAGTFSYFCLLHCAFGMTGEIIVQEPTGAPTPTATAPPATTVTPSPLPSTSTPLPPGVVPTLSTSMLGLLALALAGAALFLLKRS
jgi:plastocyanin